MSTTYNPPATPLDVRHEDHEILVVDKPSGLLSVPGKLPGLEDCLLARVQAAYPHALLIHRLDRDTSGVMIFALTRRAQRHISRQFEQRRTTKDYIARVQGRVAAAEGVVDQPIAVDWENRPRQKVCAETGRPAQTGWRVLRHEGDTTRLRLTPVTGRSHQLRVHMLWMGHAILGDPLYDPDGAQQHERLMLHAQSLRLRHPDGGAHVTYTATCPF